VELCTTSSYHDPATGALLVDEAKFPDLAKLVARSKGLGFKMAWYMNACGCHDPTA